MLIERRRAIGAFLGSPLDGGRDDFPCVESPGWATVAVPREKWIAM